MLLSSGAALCGFTSKVKRSKAIYYINMPELLKMDRLARTNVRVIITLVVYFYTFERNQSKTSMLYDKVQ